MSAEWLSIFESSKIDLENATLGLSNKLTNEFLSVFDVSSNIPLCEIIENKYKNQEFDELELLFSKHKNILTDDDKEYIKFIIEKRRKEIDKQLDKE